MTRIRFVERTGSTNSDLLAEPHAPEGEWLISARQDGGRGRQNRAWESPVGNFHGSTLIRLRSGDPPAGSLALAAGLALIRAVEAAAPATGLMLKWPNDLLLGSAKLAGIPPLFGFWPKLMVFQAAVDAGLQLLALAAAALTVIGAYYYLRVIKIMYFDAPAEPLAPARGRTETVLIAACALIISPLGYLLINPLTTAAADAASVF